MNFASSYVLAVPKKQQITSEIDSRKAANSPCCFAGAESVSDLMEDEADTNVVSAKFDSLREPRNAFTGDPYSCSNCDAFLSAISKLKPVTDHLDNKKQHMWICEFCNFENKLNNINEHELPQTDDITYLIEPPSSNPAGDINKENVNLNDIDSDLNKFLVPGKFLDPNHKKIENYLSYHFDIVSDHVLFNFKI